MNIETLLPEWIPNIHPLIIHFPIVLLTVVVIVQFFAIILWKLTWLRTVTLVGSIVGFISLIFSFISGRQAADSVTPPTAAYNTLTSHADFALWTLVYFGILAAIYLGIRFIKAQNIKSVSTVLLLLGLIGLGLIVRTADLGGQLVYKYGVGVHRDIYNDSKLENEIDKDISSFNLERNGSWKILSGEGVESIFANDVNWVEGSFKDANIQTRVSDKGENTIELTLNTSSILFTAGNDESSIQMDVELNLCDFNGNVALVHHVQNKNNYDYFSVTDKLFRLGRIENGSDKILTEKSKEHECWINLRVVVNSRHFRGYLNDELLLHDHAKEAPASKNGLLIDGDGIIYIRSIGMQIIE